MISCAVCDYGYADAPACPKCSTAGLTRLADVAPERVRWLWPGRVPLGKLTVLDGDPALGKSTLCLDLAARVSTGAPMPDGGFGDVEGPGGVVILSAEDGIGDTIRPRADAAGADPTRLHVLEHVPTLDADGQPNGARPPSIPGDVDRLEVAVSTVGAVLVVVDVLAAFLHARTDSYRDQDVRGALMPLARMAERCGCAVVVLRHLAKSGGGHAIYRGGGSIGIIGAARSGLLVGHDPDDESRNVLAVVKANLAPLAPSLAYKLVSDERRGCARVGWLGEVAHTADALVSAEPGGGHEDGHDAASVLAEVLADGPVWVKLALDAMADAGFSKDQAKRAKAKLHVRSVKCGRPGDPESGWKWELPGDSEESAKGAKGAASENVHPSPASLPSEGDR